MAIIDDLINQVTDKALRERLQHEVDRSSKQKKFGLVFEEHIPECTPLYEIPVIKGGLVAVKGKNIQETFIVKTIFDGIANCINKVTKEECDYPVKELVSIAQVSIAQFGDPIYPQLIPVDFVENAPDSNLWHTLIEADNYHALQLLEYLYPQKVDCIYIDPPYNTGARDWKYNNDYVDNTDAYKHSKWLSMMEKRLRIAKRLLNLKDSFLIVTIDEKEYLHLGCLLEEMFPEAMITMATDVINPRAGVARPGSFTRNQEYVFFVQIGASSIVPETLDGEYNENPIWFSLMRTGSNSSRADRPNLFYPVWVSPNGKLHSIGEKISFEVQRETIEAPNKELVAIWPLRPDGRENTWQLGRGSLMKAFAEGTAKISHHGKKLTINYLRNAEKMRIGTGEIIKKDKDEDGALVLMHNEAFGKTKAPDAVWNKPSHDAGIYGSTLLSSIMLERRFSFPKSIYAEKDAIRYCVGLKPNALIVDFFAGSGTTLHAVNLLNAEDGGHRRCIMVTNNEVSDEESRALSKQGYYPGDEEWGKLGIAQYVTWPRTVCSIKGVDVKGEPLKGSYFGSDLPMSEGFRANAEFLKLGFLDKNSVALGKQFKEILPILWMKAGSIGKLPEIDGRSIPHMLILPKNKLAVLTDERFYLEFEEKLDSHPEIETVFVVTDSESAYRVIISDLKVQNTYQLYRDYLDNFRINSRR